MSEDRPSGEKMERANVDVFNEICYKEEERKMGHVLEQNIISKEKLYIYVHFPPEYYVCTHECKLPQIS